MLDSSNPPASVFKIAAGEIGYRFFGVVMWCAAITSVVGAPCVVSDTDTCHSPCTTFTTPDFATIPAFCAGTTAPILATTSPNGIVG